MRPATLTKRFYDLVAPDIPNEWEVEEVLDPFADESAAVCEAALGHVPVIWPVSHSLCYDFLRLLPEALHILSLEQIRLQKEKKTFPMMNGTTDARAIVKTGVHSIANP